LTTSGGVIQANFDAITGLAIIIADGFIPTNKASGIDMNGSSTPLSEPEYRQISDFLFDEADLLSAMDYPAWQQLLTDDIRYLMPVTQFFEVGKARHIGVGTPYFDEDADSLAVRIKLLSEAHLTSAENPRSSISLMISNVRGNKIGIREYEVKSRFLLTRVRPAIPEPYNLAGRREDILRTTDSGLKLARRTVFLTQSIIKSPNLSFFL